MGHSPEQIKLAEEHARAIWSSPEYLAVQDKMRKKMYAHQQKLLSEISAQGGTLGSILLPPTDPNRDKK